MPAGVTTEFVGVKETVKALRKIDPSVRKQFNKDMKGVLQPVIGKIKSSYPQQLMSGTTRDWIPNVESGYQIFPWTISKVRRGVTIKTSTRKNKNSVVYISQANPAGILFETVSDNKPLGIQIRRVSPRLMWPIVDDMKGDIEDGVGKIVREASRLVQKELG